MTVTSEIKAMRQNKVGLKKYLQPGAIHIRQQEHQWAGWEIVQNFPGWKFEDDPYSSCWCRWSYFPKARESCEDLRSRTQQKPKEANRETSLLTLTTVNMEAASGTDGGKGEDVWAQEIQSFSFLLAPGAVIKGSKEQTYFWISLSFPPCAQTCFWGQQKHLSPLTSWST